MTKKTISEATTVYDVVIVGGGPAGMRAAAVAASRGLRVILLEKNQSLGKKLLITGGGRCNVTNNKTDVRTMVGRYAGASQFLFSAFTQHGVTETVNWLDTLHVSLKEENEGRLFPTSNTAQTVWDVLVKELRDTKVIVRTSCTVTGITQNKQNNFLVALASGKVVEAKQCIVATGGTSRPETGSAGEGFMWLEKLGHTIVPNSYALVPLTLADRWTKSLGGVTVPDAKVTVYADTKKQSVIRGRLLFTHVGVSGPMILGSSKMIGELLEHSSVTLKVNVVPQYDAGELKHHLQNLLTIDSNKKLKNVLSVLIPPALVGPLLLELGIDGETKCHSVRTPVRSLLCSQLAGLVLNVSGLLGPEKAIVSAGGVTPAEVDFKTMESRIVPGLFLIGDVLNIDRPSGGYSLQLCWTTGTVSGLHVATS